MKNVVAALALTLALSGGAFASTDVVTVVKPVVKHTSHDVAAPFVYVGKGLGMGFKHLGQDLHLVKKPVAPKKTASDGGPIQTCRPGTICDPSKA